MATNQTMAGPPPLDFDFTTTTDYKGTEQRDLNICLIVPSTFFVVTRFYVRAFMTKGLALDDIITGVAYVLLVIFSSLEIRSVGFGSGAHIDQIPGYFVPLFFESLTTQHLLYFWTVGLVRLAVVAFLLRLANFKLWNILVFSTGSIVLVQTIVCFLFRLLECKNIADLWKPPGSANCISKDAEAVMMWTHATIGIIVDVVLLGLPIWVVKDRMMKGAKTVRVIMIFCVGIFAAITGIIRLSIMVTNDFAVDTTYKMSNIGLWSDLEGHVGLWCACFPALQPLCRLISFKLGFRSNLDSYPYRNGAKKSKTAQSDGRRTVNSSQRNSAYIRASLKAGYVYKGTSPAITEEMGYVSDSNSRSGIVTACRASQASPAMEMDEFDRHHPSTASGRIYQKTTVRVQVDHLEPPKKTFYFE